MRLAQSCGQLGQRLRHLGHRRRIEETGASVRVQAQQRQPRRAGGAARGLINGAAGQIQPELGIGMPRLDADMRLGLHIGIDAQPDGDGAPTRLAHRGQVIQLVEAIDHDPSHAALARLQRVG
jgi:hypothetical protein